MAEEKSKTTPPTAPKSAATVQPVKKPAKPREFGAWVVLTDQGETHMVENSQLRAALAAIDIKGSIVFWPFGKTEAQVFEVSPKATS